jgi:hypothetical protein
MHTVFVLKDFHEKLNLSVNIFHRRFELMLDAAAMVEKQRKMRYVYAF